VDFLLEWGREFAQSYGMAGLFIVMVIGSSPIPIPVEVIALSMITVGAPPLPTAVFASIGATLGAGVTYLIGRGIVDLANFRRKHGDKVEKAKHWLDRYGVFAVFIFALFPLGFDAIALAAGGARMHALKFLLPTLVGRMIRYNIIFHAGYGFLELLRSSS
jgi:membrane protein YqaA with SNARE-associated domain